MKHVQSRRAHAPREGATPSLEEIVWLVEYVEA